MRGLAATRWRLARSWPLAVLLVGLWGGASAATAPIEIGQEAPDFILPSTAGTKISLTQFRGKKLVLLEFYVHDFGPT